MPFLRRLSLLLSILAVVAVLLAIKLAVHTYRLEFLALDTLFSSVVASSIFIIGFLLTGILPDYKEAERIPAELRTALEAIYDDSNAFAVSERQVDVGRLRTVLIDMIESLERGLGRDGQHTHIEQSIARIDDLVAHVSALEQLGMPSNYIVRLRNAVDVVRRSLYRIGYIQRIEFLPTVHVLIQTLICAILLLLLFLKTDGSVGTALIFSFVSYLFVFALHLITVFEQPFREASHSPDKVSLYQLRELLEKLSLSPAPVPPGATVQTGPGTHLANATAGR